MSSVLVEEIPSRLREELKRQGYSIAAAAREAGESSSQRLKDVLSGRQKCPVELLARLEVLGVDISYVLTGRGRSQANTAEQIGSEGALSTSTTPGPGLAEVKLY